VTEFSNPKAEVRTIETRQPVYNADGLAFFNLISEYTVKVEPLYGSDADAAAGRPSAWRVIKMLEVKREIR
jgi:hypothetical protein